MAENDVYEYRLKKLEDAIADYTNKVADLERRQVVTESDYKYIIEKLDALSTKVDRLVDSSGDNWNALIKSIITASSGGLVGFVLSKILG